MKGTKIKKSAYRAVWTSQKPQPAQVRQAAPEGFLFPNTYELTADSTATSTLKQMVDQYKAVTREIEFEADAKKLKRSPYEVLIVASIIEREVNREEYRPRWRGSSTTGSTRSRSSTLTPLCLRREAQDHHHDQEGPPSKSKYNTYRYKGLPPGPISPPARPRSRRRQTPRRANGSISSR